MITTCRAPAATVALFAASLWLACCTTPGGRHAASPPAQPLVLFDGVDFTHWAQADGGPAEWKLVDGAMEIVPGKGSIVTTDAFRDFQLHLEFRLPQSDPQAQGQQRANSGVYIQRRYEVQILDSFAVEAGKSDCGAIYNFKAPDHSVCREPGEWQTYDITFYSPRWEGQGDSARKIQNARITVTHNDILIHDDVELTSKTGAGRPEGPDPGPILLQDHGAPVQFRNIRILPLD